MRPYRHTLAEQETTIRWDREERIIHLFSADPTVWRKLARLGLEPVKRSWLPGQVEAGRFYQVPLARFRWGLKSEAIAAASRRRTAGRPPAFQKRHPDRVPSPVEPPSRGR